MVRKNFLVLLISFLFVLVITISQGIQNVLAGTTGVGVSCDHSHPDDCEDGYSCRQDPSLGSLDFICQPRIGVGGSCENTDPDPCIDRHSCEQDPTPGLPGSLNFSCQPDIQPTKPQPVQPQQPVKPDDIAKIFGKIKVPDRLGGLITNNLTGAGAISQFITNFIALIYAVAAIVLVFMLVWAAFEWLTSGGDKEKLATAQKRILHAIIGIILFAVAFAIIAVLGTFTGFKFFKGQGVTRSNEPGIKFICPDGTKVGGGSDDPDIACEGHGT